MLRAAQQGTQGVLRTAGAQVLAGTPGRGPPEGPPAGRPEGARRAPGGSPEAKHCDKCANMRLKTKQQTAFELPNLEKACFRMPWDVLEQKRADHTYTPEVRSISGLASLHPGQSMK